MKVSKMLPLVALLVLGVSSGRVWGAETHSCATNMQFVQMLVSRLAVQVSARTNDMSESDYYAVLANGLAKKNIPQFTYLPYDGFVQYPEMVEVLYAVAGGKEPLDPTGKLHYLTANGFLQAGGKFDSCVSIEDLRSAFYSPRLNGLIAEPYSEPASTGENLGGDAPGVTAEDTASRI